MTNLVKDLKVVNWIGDSEGIFQAIIKVPAGFMSACDLGSKLPSLNKWKKGTLQSIQFKAEGTNHWMTVFAKKGKNVILADEALLKDMTVGVINGLFYDSNLCDQTQYKAVNAKTWADKAFVINS